MPQPGYNRRCLRPAGCATDLDGWGRPDHFTEPGLPMRRRVLCGIVLMVCLVGAAAPAPPVAPPRPATRPATTPATRPAVARAPATAPAAMRPLWPIPTPPP